MNKTSSVYYETVVTLKSIQILGKELGHVIDTKGKPKEVTVMSLQKSAFNCSFLSGLTLSFIKVQKKNSLEIPLSNLHHSKLTLYIFVFFETGIYSWLYHDRLNSIRNYTVTKMH